MKSAAVFVAAAAMFITGCGVAAPKNVASIDGVGITMQDVIDTARDPLYQLVSEDSEDSVISGDAARDALMINVAKKIWVAEARRWGLDTDAKRADAESTLEQQLSAMPEPTDLSSEMRKGFVDLFAAQLALQERFEKLDPTDDADLHRIYDLSPLLWARTCAYIMVVPAGSDIEVRRLVDRGVDFDEITERIEGTQVVTSPDDGCMSEGSIPGQIRDDLRGVPIGGADIFEIDAGGVPQLFMVKVVSRETVGFDDARQDLMGIVAALIQSGPQEWVNLRLVEAGVDPRFGSGITLDGQGQPYVVPPVGPIQQKLTDDAMGFDSITG